jgi:hypothetical protein
MSPRGRVGCPLGALFFERLNPEILLRYQFVVFLEEGEDSLEISLLISGLCANHRDFLRDLRAFPCLTLGDYLHIVVFSRRYRGESPIPGIRFRVWLPRRAEDSVVPLRGGSGWNEINMIIDLIIVVVVVSVGCTGHCDEGLLKRNRF